MISENRLSITKLASGIVVYLGIPVIDELVNAGYSQVQARSLLGVLIVYAEASSEDKKDVRTIYASQIKEIESAGIDIDKVKLQYPEGWRSSLGLWLAKVAAKFATKDGRGRQRILTMRQKYGDDVFKNMGNKGGRPKGTKK